MTHQDNVIANNNNDNNMTTTKEEVEAGATEEEETKKSVSFVKGTQSDTAADDLLPLRPKFSEEGSVVAAVMCENSITSTRVDEEASSTEIITPDLVVAEVAAVDVAGSTDTIPKEESSSSCVEPKEEHKADDIDNNNNNNERLTMLSKVEDAGATQDTLSVAVLHEPTSVDEEEAWKASNSFLPTTSGSVLLPPSLVADATDEIYASRSMSEDSGDDEDAIPMLTLSMMSGDDNHDDDDDGIILPPSYSNVSSSSPRNKTAGGGSSLLLSLPIDSLHCVASFLTPEEWAEYGQTCTAANKVCREIFRRVRMHGFRCATEVVTAWKFDQLADAKELAALYISAGVPIYPHSLGHSYQTICWRMSLEAKKMQEEANEAAAEANNASEETPAEEETNKNAVDRYYNDRNARGRDAAHLMCSYLEDKSVFFAGPAPTSPTSTLSGRWGSMNALHLVGADGQPQPPAPVAISRHASPLASPTSSPARSLSQSELLAKSRAPKVPVSIHRHLLDQHLLGRSCVDDEDGKMEAPPVSLSADFFHPHLATHSISGHSRNLFPPTPPPPRSFTIPTVASLNTGALGENLLDDPAFQAWASRAAATVHNRLGGGAALEDAEELAELQDLYSQIFAVDRSVPAAAGDAENAVQDPPVVGQLPTQDGSPRHSIGLLSHDDSLLSPALQSRHGSHSVMGSVDLEVYSASAASAKDQMGDLGERKRHLQTRFAFYQRRLEVLLLHGDSAGYEECILDFWDEFFPLSAKIHYYDGKTAVPRISCLQQFLTQPCPKEIGIVQCEIERVKISSKKRKGVSMKGRLFPTYEYRLFIKDVKHSQPEGADTPFNPEETGIRRDTVLMVAKNRGRKHVDTSGVVSLTPAAKKGANNYYLYTPQQGDVDTHFNSINQTEEEVTGNKNGVSMSAKSPPSSNPPVLLGRLQSNFIGTEFQIYTPKLRKGIPGKPLRRSASLNEGHASFDEDADYESGAASDTGGSSRRRSRFGRLSLRRSSSHAPSTTTSDPALPSPTASRTKSRSQKEAPGVRAHRTNRRAIANSTETSPDSANEAPLNQEPFLCEEEDGAITYTANLLGSRPRIMDVCIPKISQEGNAGAGWRKYLENNDDTEDCAPYNRMLNCFKQLQQRLESQNENNEDDEQNANADGEATDDFGLMALQNRPPWWNIELGSFVLNFRGRVSVASVKNFQLCDRNDHDHIMLQFGRIKGRHSFTMDYQYPLTAVQAFSIAISSLQSKISFG